MTSEISRRALLKRMSCVSFGGLAALAMRTARSAAQVCADTKAMDSGEQGMRASLNYTEAGSDPAKTCSACAFFRAAGEGCGTCTIFNGAPANPKGHCDSWGAKV